MNRARREEFRKNAELRKARERAHADQYEHARRTRAAEAVLRAHNDRAAETSRFAEGDAFLSIVKERSPVLVVPELVPVLRLVAALPRARAVDDWAPRAKGRMGRLVSLFEHLFATVPVPSVVWAGLFDDARTIAPLVVWLASGGSFFQYAKTRLAIPLTRKACHVALSLRSESSLLRAIRKAQVLSLTNDAALAHAWASSVHAANISSIDKETFFASFLEWLAAREHESDDVAIMLDYAAERFTENAKFSMKGRTIDAFLRDARAWHVELAKLRVVRQSFFRPSGFKPFIRGTPPSPRSPRIVWRVEEILDAKSLFEEGRRMGHCVYSYGGAVQTGMTSIWIMTMEDGNGPTGRWAMLTIEVRNQTRSIVQARGRFNRMPTNDERTILARFAAQNGLTVAV
ncbi:MAG TPA: PcfJ domain-containing protein [Polyangiaceae bacterium]